MPEVDEFDTSKGPGDVESNADLLKDINEVNFRARYNSVVEEMTGSNSWYKCEGLYKGIRIIQSI